MHKGHPVRGQRILYPHQIHLCHHLGLYGETLLPTHRIQSLSVYFHRVGRMVCCFQERAIHMIYEHFQINRVSAEIQLSLFLMEAQKRTACKSESC